MNTNLSTVHPERSFFEGFCSSNNRKCSVCQFLRPSKWLPIVGKEVPYHGIKLILGQGTGLGLSLSYDIIKAHGDKLKVETREGEYAEFKVSLPPIP